MVLAFLLTLASSGIAFAEQLRNSRSLRFDKDVALRVEKVLVEIYYETLCPSSIELLNGSFRTVWQDKDLQKRMDVRLYPFGNAQMFSESEVSSDFKLGHPHATYPVIDCQHGEEECLGNRIQACAIQELKTSESVPLILCMASQGSSVGIKSSASACGAKLDIRMTGVMGCASSLQGHKLMTHLGKKSLDPDLHRTYVPFVLVDGKHEKAADEDNLLGPLCSALSVPKPAACEASASVSDAGQISLAHHNGSSPFCFMSDGPQHA